MSFQGITFDGQNVSPKDDGALYAAHNGDGIIDGCAMTLSGDDLVIQSGHILACGRVCQVDGATTVDLSARQLSTGYIEVILNYDLSRSEGDQCKESFVESATTTFPALTQDDINGSGTLYQVALAIVQISGGNLTNITWSLGWSPIIYGAYTERLNISGGGNYKSIQNYHNGNNYSGIAFDDTGSLPQTEIYAKNGRITFRPKGQGDNSVQAYISENGYLNGNRFRYIAFTGGWCLQVGQLCHLNIYRNISSTPSANTWHNLIQPNEIPTPIAATRGLGILTLDTGNTGGQVNLRILTTKQIQWALSGTSGSWNILGTIDYVTSETV